MPVVILLLLAFAMREFKSAASAQDVWRLTRGCGEALLPQILSNVQSRNPLHFEVFFYPPVPAMVVASVARLWSMLGGPGTVAAVCGTVGLLFELATVVLVYLIGRFWSRSHGLIAMAFYAVSMATVVADGNVQVYSAFFVALATYSILRAASQGGTHAPALAGVWLGLGVASKYLPLFFAGLLFIPYLLRRRASGSIADDSRLKSPQAAEGALLPRMWTGIAWALMGVAVAVVWVGLVKQEFLFGVLRTIYEQHSHENPFEYHLPWINRLYGAILAGVSLVGLTGGVALIIPWYRRLAPWEWARALFLRNRLWMAPCMALVLTVAVSIGVPAVLNLNDFTRHFVGIAKGRASGDNGFFPEYRPAPSYIGAYIPEGTGLPLYFGGLAGIIYSLIRRDKRAALLIASAVPAYLALEVMRVKVGVYALELYPFWCLLAAMWLGDLCQQHHRAWQVVGRVLVAGIVSYSIVYSLAWAEFYSVRNSPQVQAGVWLSASVPPGNSMGVRSALIVTGGPGLLPAARSLVPYPLADYTDEPEYVLLPNGVHAIVEQYLEGLKQGYVYTPNDWFVSRPTPADLHVLSRIVRQEGYVLLKEFKKEPVIFGMRLGSDSLTGRTWMAEHSSTIGLRIYRRVAGSG